MTLILNIFIYNALAVTILTGSLKINPRYWLKDYPQEIIRDVPPLSGQEKRGSLGWGILFLAVLFGYPLVYVLSVFPGGPVSFIPIALTAYLMLMSFNLVDLLIVDWFLLCSLTPPFVVIPGTEGNRGYGNYRFHLRAFFKGSLIMAGAALSISGAAVLAGGRG